MSCRLSAGRRDAVTNSYVRAQTRFGVGEVYEILETVDTADVASFVTSPPLER